MSKVFESLVNGSLLDPIGGNNGTLTAGVSRGFVQTDKGLALEFDGADTLVTCGDSTEIQNVFDGGGSAEAWINLKSSGESNAGRIVTKGGWTFYQGSASGIGSKLRLYQFFSGVDGWWETDDVTIIFNIWHHVIVTYDNSAVTNNPILYVNGVKYSVGDGLTEQATPVGTRTTDVGTDLTIGGGVGSDGTTDGNILNAQLYDHVLTTKERNELYANFLASSQIGQPKRGFTVQKPTDLSRYTDDGLVAAYNMTLVNNQVIDLTGNGNDGTNVGCLPSEDGLVFNGVDSGLTGSLVIATATNATILCRYQRNNTSNNMPILGLSSTNSFSYLRLTNDGRITLETDTNTNTHSETLPSDDLIDHTFAIVVTNGSSQMYFDGIAFGSAGTLTDNLTINRIGRSNSNFWNGTIYNTLKIYNRAVSATEVIDYHNSFILPTLVETFDEGADGIAKLPREWIAGTGTYKISQVNQSDTLPTFPGGIKLYDKYLECTVAGTSGTLSYQGTGTYSWDMFKGGDGNTTTFNFINSLVGAGNRYSIDINSDESVSLEKDGSNLFVTAASYTSINTWYHFDVTVTKAGIRTALMDGIEIVEATGSNPVTDTDYMTSIFTSIDFDAGDRVANFNYKDEIEQ